ncbi:MAG: phage tail protein [Oscillospiraceae bacterium]|nr:phage tail protein [Oscillospiraceae bacterium]
MTGDYKESEMMNGYPFAYSLFKVSFDDINTSFGEVDGVDTIINVIEYREEMSLPSISKIRGLNKYGNIMFKRGIVKDKVAFTNLYSYFNESIRYKVVSINLLNEDRENVAIWRVDNAYILKLTCSDWDETSSEAIIKELEISHEGLTRIK